MTINIGLVTSDALVLGCDSIASQSDMFLDPFKWECDENGTPIKDAEGKFTLKFTGADITPIVTNAWGSVTKLFRIHPPPSPMLAVTSGLAKLSERSIASITSEFLTAQESVPKLSSCKDICTQFLEFFREKYEQHYKDSTIPEEYREAPEFLDARFSQGNIHTRRPRACGRFFG